MSELKSRKTELLEEKAELLNDLSRPEPSWRDALANLDRLMRQAAGDRLKEIEEELGTLNK